jgi:hypothetical protein
LPKSGDAWPERERKLWLQLLEGGLKLIYKDKEAPTETAKWKPQPKGVPAQRRCRRTRADVIHLLQ